MRQYGSHLDRRAALPNHLVRRTAAGPDPVQRSFDLADDRLHGIAQLVRSNGYKRIARLDCRGQLGIAALKPAARIFVATLGRD